MAGAGDVGDGLAGAGDGLARAGDVGDGLAESTSSTSVEAPPTAFGEVCDGRSLPSC